MILDEVSSTVNKIECESVSLSASSEITFPLTVVVHSTNLAVLSSTSLLKEIRNFVSNSSALIQCNSMQSGPLSSLSVHRIGVMCVSLSLPKFEAFK